MKFGGTSVEDAPAFANVARIISEHEGQRPVVVVSAMSGVTNALLKSVGDASQGNVEAAKSSLAQHYERYLNVARTLLSGELAKASISTVEQIRETTTELLYSIGSQRSSQPTLQDSVVTIGERLSAMLLTAILRERGLKACEVDGRRCIVTEDRRGGAAPLLDKTFRCTREQLHSLIESSVVPVLGGFMGSTTLGETTTLGRGGSDYSASLIGAALMSKEIQIWTDVSGVLTANPRVVPGARTIPRLSYDEAAELAYFGAKVLHPKTIQPAVEGNIPVRIYNSRLPNAAGTLICAACETSPQTVKAIAHKTGVTTLQITSARMLGAYGFLRALFEVFDTHRTAVDVVTTSEVSVSLSLDDAIALPSIIEELQPLGAVRVEKRRAIICVVGEGLRSTPGIAARIFNTISDINVSLISQGASRINITFAIDEQHVDEAVRRLHYAFFEEPNVQTITATALAVCGEA